MSKKLFTKEEVADLSKNHSVHAVRLLCVTYPDVF